MMKQIIITSAFVLALAACGEAPTQTNNAAAPAAESSNTASAPTAPAAEVIKVTAKQLVKDYEENEAAGDAKYKGKALEVSGQLEAIEKGMMDETNLQLQGKDFKNVLATLKESEEEKALKLKKKSKITLNCISGGEFASLPVLKDCSIKE